MNRPFRAITALLIYAATTPGWAQEPPTPTPALGADRVREIAIHWDMPDGLPRTVQRDLNVISAAFERKQPDAALTQWRDLIKPQNNAQPFNVSAALDYILNRLAAARSKLANDACRKLRFYDAQENAVFDHVSTLEKQFSAYAGDDIYTVPLREPQLAEYGSDGDPVTLAPGTSVGKKELQASYNKWKARLPEISEVREAALDAFVKAVLDDTTLAAEIKDVQIKLRGEIPKS